MAMTLHGPMYAHGIQMEPQFANDPAGLLSNAWVGYTDSSYIFHDGTDDKLNKVITNIDWQISGDVTKLTFDPATQTFYPTPMS